jgi:hypothetical protein
MTERDWTDGLKERLAELQIQGQIGHYRPTVDGIRPEGQLVGLGFGCYVYKVYENRGF